MVHGWRDVTTIRWTRKQETLKLADKHIHVMRCQAQEAGDKPTASVAIKHGRVCQVAHVETRLGTNLVEQLVWSWSLVHLVDTGEDMVTLAWGGPAHWGWRSSMIFFGDTIKFDPQLKNKILVPCGKTQPRNFSCLFVSIIMAIQNSTRSLLSKVKILQQLFKQHSTFWHSVNILSVLWVLFSPISFVFALLW